MPVLGDPSNYKNLDAYTMQEFQLENISPERIVICATGVENHNEFLDLASTKLSNLFYNKNTKERSKAVFNEVEVKNVSQSSKAQFALVFETESIQSKDLFSYLLLERLLGSIEVNQFDPLSLKRGKFVSQIYQKNPNVYSLEATPMHFSDTGMFVIRSQVNPNGIQNVLESIASVFKSLDKIPETEFQAYKNLLWQQIDHYLQHRDQRVQEMLKQASLLGQVRLSTL